MALGFGGKSAQLASYFEEVAAHFATLEDAEEKSLLAANAIEGGGIPLATCNACTC